MSPAKETGWRPRLQALLLAACVAFVPAALHAQKPAAPAVNPASREAEISRLSQLALDAFNKRLFEQALSINRQALAMARQSADRATQANLLDNIGLCLERLGRYREALDAYLQARGLYGKDEDHAADIAVARGYYLTGDYAKALPLFEHKYQLALRHGEPGVVDKVLTAYTDLLVAVGQSSKALQVAQRGQAYWFQMGYHAGSSGSQAAMIRLLHSLGHYRKALPLAALTLKQREEAVARSQYYVKPPPNPEIAYSTPPDNPDSAEALYLVAESHRGLRDFAKALQFHQRSLTMREKVHAGDHPLIAQALNAVAETLRESGKHSEALPFARRALAMREKMLGAEHPDVAHSLLTLARLALDTGNPAEALPLAQRALAIGNKALGEDNAQLLPYVSLLATLHAALKDQPSAAPYTQRAGALRNKARVQHPSAAQLDRLVALALKPPPRKPVDHYGGGIRALDGKNYQKAVIHFRLGLAELQGKHSKDFTSTSHHERLAEALAALSRHGEAVVEQQHVIDIYARQGKADHPDLSSTYYKLGRYHGAAGARAAALKAYTRAAAIGEQSWPDHMQTAENLRALAAMHEAMGDIRTALPVYQRSLAIAARHLPPEHQSLLTIREHVATLQKKLAVSPAIMAQ